MYFASSRLRRAETAFERVVELDPSDDHAGWKERDERLAAEPATVGFSDDGHDGDERTRLDAVRSAVLDVWRLDVLEGYLARLAEVRFSSDWSRAWPDHSVMPPARPDNVVERLRQLGTPLLLLHGRQDMTYPAALVEPTLALIHNARGVVLNEAGHMAYVDQPEAWLTAISDFLDEAGP